MRLRRSTAALLLPLATNALAAPAPHPCAADALAHAKRLLTLQFGEPPESASVDEKVTVLPSVKALRGKGKLDVLEVWGHIYKADYRMRFLYAQIKGSCALMGQEILDASDPY